MTTVAGRLVGGATIDARVPAWLAPTFAALVNAVAFVVVSPDVNDIFAARARQSAAENGVGLTYWFSWFGGGTTPGNYSVLTPYLSVAIGALVLGAIATTLITPLAWLVIRGTSHPIAGIWIVTLSAGLNLWSGRVPFALGSVMAVVTLIFVVQRRIWLAALFAVLAVLSSPVAGAFIAIALAGVFLVRNEYRRVCLVTCLVVAASVVAVGLIFGQPGPESFSLVQVLQVLATLLPFLLAAPPDYLRATIWLGVAATPLLFFVHNGMGDNILRLGWYCLPAVVVATSPRSVRRALLAILVALAFCAKQGFTDVRGGTQKTASVAYYQNLIAELDSLQHELLNYRLEVVEDGTHTAAYALLDHAMLARGWENQDDHALNRSLAKPTLDAITYKVWLQDNAVGYVAIASTSRKPAPEYELVSTQTPAYLSEVWHDDDWTLFQVSNPDPIVRAPESVTARSQSQLSVKVPCACSFPVRVRFSKYLGALDRTTRVAATLADDGFGWTTMTTTRAGLYVMSGHFTEGFR